jgi:hypothetical protein
MVNDDDVDAILRNIRFIALQCFDLTAIRRLQLLADQIEQKVRTPSAQTKPSVTEDQGDADPPLRNVSSVA